MNTASGKSQWKGLWTLIYTTIQCGHQIRQDTHFLQIVLFWRFCRLDTKMRKVREMYNHFTELQNSLDLHFIEWVFHMESQVQPCIESEHQRDCLGGQKQFVGLDYFFASCVWFHQAIFLVKTKHAPFWSTCLVPGHFLYNSTKQKFLSSFYKRQNWSIQKF